MLTKRRAWECCLDAVDLGMVFRWLFTYQSKA